MTLNYFPNESIQFRTKTTPSSIIMCHLTRSFLQSITVDISKLIDWINKYPTKAQEELFNEYMLKSSSIRSFLFNCTKEVSYNSTYVISNHPY